MAQFAKTELLLNHRFDAQRRRHYLNNSLTVLHCHHFAALYSQLALDAGETALLHQVAEDSFRDVLDAYYAEHQIETINERIAIACQYYAAVGLGKMEVTYLGADSGRVELLVSHIDDGWKKKWGAYDRPVNFITTGYIAALFGAVLEKPVRSFAVSEIESIVMGASRSLFTVVRS